jgi:outer membrane protein assembly factor BamB
VLPSGHVLLAVSKGKPYPGGGAIELDAAGKTLWEYRGTQSEVDTVQPLGGERVLVTESGPKPRLLEVGRDGKVAFEMTLRCQTSNHHMQTRMARKLANGNYLVPHLLDRVVREYRPDGTTAWEFKTPAEVKDAWPFTAIRLPDGHTLVSCTMGHLVVEADAQGKVVWSLSNGDLPEPMLNDACGAQRLPNGNTVVASYRAGSGVKLVEVTREKRVVWTYNSPSKTGIHHFQVLDTQGEALPWPPMR